MFVSRSHGRAGILAVLLMVVSLQSWGEISLIRGWDANGDGFCQEAQMKLSFPSRSSGVILSYSASFYVKKASETEWTRFGGGNFVYRTSAVSLEESYSFPSQDLYDFKMETLSWFYGSSNPDYYHHTYDPSNTPAFNDVPGQPANLDIFSGTRYSLTVTVSPDYLENWDLISLSPGGDAEFMYRENTLVSVEAWTPDDYIFAGWSGAISGTANPATIVMDSNKAVTAQFVSVNDRFALSLSATPPSGGTLVPDVPPGEDGKYSAGTVVNVTATPSNGYSFSSWGGDVNSTLGTLQLTMVRNYSVTANFAANPVAERFSLTLASSPDSAGSVNAAPAPGGDGKYAAGTAVTLTATAAAGKFFQSWSGSATGSTNPTTIVIDANKNVTASFGSTPPVDQRFTLSFGASPIEGGVINATPQPDADGKYAANTGVTLTATSSPGFIFQSWSGAANEGVNPLAITMNADKSITANFVSANDRFVLSVAPVDPARGSVSADPAPEPDGAYAAGTVVNVTAIAAEGHVFSSWSGDATGCFNPLQVRMVKNVGVTAEFVPGNSANLTTSCSGSAKVKKGKTIIKGKGTVANVGQSISPKCEAQVFLSPTADPAQGTLLATLQVKKLKPGKSGKLMFSAKLPEGTVVSGMQLILVADPSDVVAETSECDNAGASVPLP